jgi:hypothetical protein
MTPHETPNRELWRADVGRLVHEGDEGYGEWSMSVI